MSAGKSNGLSTDGRLAKWEGQTKEKERDIFNERGGHDGDLYMTTYGDVMTNHLASSEITEGRLCSHIPLLLA